MLMIIFYLGAWSMVAFASSPSGSNAEAAPSSRRPNILLVMTDDQRTDDLRGMVKTRRWLARSGIQFTRAFASTPWCCPARATIFTGRYAHNHGVKTNFDTDQLAHRSTVQRYLQGRGYRTGYVGKFLNSWNVNNTPPYFNSWAMSSQSSVYRGATFNVQGDVRVIDAYHTTFVSNRAVRFLRQSENWDRQPWFLTVAPIAPHGPASSDRKYRTADVPAPKLRPSVFEDDPAIDPLGRTDKPPYVQQRSYNRDPVRAHTRRLRSLLSVDEMMGRLRGELRKLQEYENTLVVFTADNGLMLGEHELGNKRVPYLESVRIPLLMAWPGRLPRSRDGRLVGHPDIAPTFLAAARTSPEARSAMDGRNLLDNGWQRERILNEGWHTDIVPSPPTWASIMTSGYVYTEYYDPEGQNIEFREYYDFQEDPYQLRNLLGDNDPTNDPPGLNALSSQLEADRSCQGSGCP
jgi:arylsulfatase A-like enzyme